MINNVTLVGRITKEPELRYTPQNKAVASSSNFQVLEKSNQANGERISNPASKPQNNDSFGSDPMEISDDDLPF